MVWQNNNQFEESTEFTEDIPHCIYEMLIILKEKNIKNTFAGDMMTIKLKCSKWLMRMRKSFSNIWIIWNLMIFLRAWNITIKYIAHHMRLFLDND